MRGCTSYPCRALKHAAIKIRHNVFLRPQRALARYALLIPFCILAACDDTELTHPDAKQPQAIAIGHVGYDMDSHPMGRDHLNNGNNDAKTRAPRTDLDVIKNRGVLRVLINQTEDAALPRQAIPVLHDSRLIRAFAAHLGVRTEFIAIDDPEQLHHALLQHRGDLIASATRLTKNEKSSITLTHPIAHVTDWVVGKRGAADLPTTISELAGKVVHVRANAPFMDTLVQLRTQRVPSLRIATVSSAQDADDLVLDVSQGKFKLTVIDNQTLDLIQTYNQDVQALFPLAREGRSVSWAVRPDQPALLAAINAFLIEHAMTAHTKELFTGDLSAIKERGVLRVLTRNNGVNYFLHHGKQMGFEYELAEQLAKQLGVRLEMVVPNARDQLIPWLLAGRGDMIAASMTVTPERKRLIRFSQPYMYVHEVIVQRTQQPHPIDRLSDLKGKTIHATRSSSHYDTLIALQKRYGPFHIAYVDEDTESEQLIAMVAQGKIQFAVADSHMLQAESRYYNGTIEGGAILTPLHTTTRFDPTPTDDTGAQALAFAVRPNNPQLAAVVNNFATKTYRSTIYNMARQRYFRDIPTARINPHHSLPGTMPSQRHSAISPYDTIFRRLSSQYHLDWRLMAAQAFRESGFDPKARSGHGALGLFQLMPETGAEMGFTNLEDPQQNTHAGIKYMYMLMQRFDPRIPFSQRIQFALASYNVGYGHVRDAQRLAEQLGLDAHRWFGNVEKAMLLLQTPKYAQHARYGYCRGSEAVAYVANIHTLYNSYVKLVH